MATLKLLGGDAKAARLHIVFFHGLSGSIDGTWSVKVKGKQELWPLWIIDTISQAAIWAIEYDAAKSNYTGHALPLEDRGKNIWDKLRNEPCLNQNQSKIAFVCHSMGGLVAIQVLRCIERNRGDAIAENFKSRVRRVAFLATPHKGSFLALAFLLAKPILLTWAIRDLRSGSPQLRDSNDWFRKYVPDNQLSVLQLAEGLPIRFCGLPLFRIVTPESADAGLVDTPTIVDETHQTINKPRNRDNEVYTSILSLLDKPDEGSSTETRISLEIKKSEESSKERDKQTHAMLEKMQSTISIQSLRDSKTLNKGLQDDLNRLLQRRLFSEVNAVAEAKQLLDEIRNGEFQLASIDNQKKAAAWCSLILSPTEPEEASAALSPYNRCQGELVAAAKFQIRAAKGDLNAALNDIAKYNTLTSRSVGYLAMLHDRGADKANEWLVQTDTKPSDLDDSALRLHLVSLQQAGQTAAALELVETIDECRLEQCAALNDVVAASYFAGAVVGSSFEDIQCAVLVSLEKSVPLKDDAESLNLRRLASKCYSRLARLARELDLPTVAAKGADRSMWLDLNDPDKGDEAQNRLEESLSNSDTLLRRFLWALQCGIALDLTAVDQEIERQIALTGTGKPEHGFARLAMVMALGGKEPADGARYLDLHRKHLYQHLNPIFVLGLEAEILARAGETTRALSRLRDAEGRGMDSATSALLHALIDQANDQDDLLASLTKNFQRFEKITDLRELTTVYFEREAFSDVLIYGKRLVERTGDSSDARMLAIALYESDCQNEALKVLDGYPPLKNSQEMELLRAQSLFELGKIKESLKVLDELQCKGDFEEARLLQLKLTITSGDWDALQTFVELQWFQRETRSALELLRAGQIAQYIGSRRGKVLVRKAAETSADDPEILAACYHAATSAGWEDDDSVASWMLRAAKLSEASDEEGPVQVASIDQIIKWAPEWKKRVSRTNEQAISGQMPLFLVAQALNHSLTQMVLSQAIWNTRQTDVKSRSMILTTSGKSLPALVKARTIALDPVALLTMSYLGVLKACRKVFECLIIPHETLAWLFEEKTKLGFHQPSQVKAARTLQRSIAEETVRVHEAKWPMPEGLYREVGCTLAELLFEAKTSKNDDQKRFVVVDGPIWKVDSAMTVEAKLGDYAQYVRSTADIVEALAQRGGLTSARLEAARRKYKHSARAENNAIPTKAILLLDGTTASSFLHSDLLDPLRDVGFEVVVPASEEEESLQLIEYETRAEKAQDVVENLRHWLSNGIKEGWIQLEKASRNDKLKTSQWFTHPSVSLLSMTMNVDAIVVEDRYFNKHSKMPTQNGSVPILTTWALLDTFREQGAISDMEWSEARAVMRKSGYTLAPIDTEELSELVIKAEVNDGRLIEPAELRALRESVARVRMSDILQVPEEIPWLNQVSVACIRVISQIWQEENNDSDAQVKSEWLVDLGNPTLWAHRFCEPGMSIDQVRCLWFTRLVFQSTGREDSAAVRYRNWLDAQVIVPLQEEEPELFNIVIGDVKAHFNALVSRVQMDEQIDEAANGN